MNLIDGDDVGISVFLSLEENQPLGICVFNEMGGTVITLEDFIEESKIGLSSQMSQRYAAAFEIMAKQLRDGCNDNECGR